ncbi:MAG: O-antigen ligase family protein [Deltaproteobacteria bacterium]
MNKERLIDFCQQAAEFSLCAVVFFIPISIALVNIWLVLFGLFWLMKKIFSAYSRMPETAANFFLLALALFSFLSVINTISMESSAIGIVKIFKNLVLFFAAVDILNNRRSIKRITWTIILGLTLLSFDGIFQYVYGKDFIRGYPIHIGLRYPPTTASVWRIGASMEGGPNDYATYLITLIPMLLSLILYYFKGEKKIIPGLIGMIAFFCMFNTQYRGAALGFVLIMLLFGFIKKDVRFVVILLIFILLLPFVLPKTLISWALTHLNPYDFFVEEFGRRWHWYSAMNMIKAHPFIGVGINTYSINYDHYKMATDPLSGFYAHNAYLQMAAEIGLLGLFAFLGAVIAIARNWWKSYKKISEPWLRTVSLGAIGGFTGYLSASILESTLHSSNLAVLFWFMASLIIAINKLATKTGGV